MKPPHDSTAVRWFYGGFLALLAALAMVKLIHEVATRLWRLA
jgi:hypothetical protein